MHFLPILQITTMAPRMKPSVGRSAEKNAAGAIISCGVGAVHGSS
jgi:hypothetical protein